MKTFLIHRFNINSFLSQFYSYYMHYTSATVCHGKDLKLLYNRPDTSDAHF